MCGFAGCWRQRRGVPAGVREVITLSAGARIRLAIVSVSFLLFDVSSRRSWLYRCPLISFVLMPDR
ncbi:hypothetical protein WS82_01735 [Burkholderia sp. MSMB2041]|nr:hypothetical protein WS77_15440 [Burkholderia sp. MSMB0265]KVG97019.1 hypothetical protein WS82_01735 [Burkholderia sp. MSMB2041]